MIKWHNVITIIDMRPFTEEARGDIREYCDIMGVLMSRNAYDNGLLFDITEADVLYAFETDEQLTEKSDLLFKQLFLKYGHNNKTSRAATS
jgi:hypothetical protein